MGDRAPSQIGGVIRGCLKGNRCVAATQAYRCALPELRLASLHRSSAFQSARQRIPMRHPAVRPNPNIDQNRFLVALTILPIDTNGYIPSQNAAADPHERRALNSTITARPMARDDVGWIMPENDCEAVAEFIRTKGITRCPTACVLPTQGSVLPPTGLRWKSTRLRGTVYAEHKPRLAGDLFSRPHK